MEEEINQRKKYLLYPINAIFIPSLFNIDYRLLRWLHMFCMMNLHVGKFLVLIRSKLYIFGIVSHYWLMQLAVYPTFDWIWKAKYYNDDALSCHACLLTRREMPVKWWQNMSLFNDGNWLCTILLIKASLILKPRALLLNVAQVHS